MRVKIMRVAGIATVCFFCLAVICIFAYAVVSATGTMPRGFEVPLSGRSAIRVDPKIAIDFETGELFWVVTHVTVRAGAEPVFHNHSFRISVSERSMTTASEKRLFSEKEAAEVARFMKILRRYVNESTVWWMTGQGEQVKKPETPGGKVRERL